MKLKFHVKPYISNYVWSKMICAPSPPLKSFSSLLPLHALEY